MTDYRSKCYIDHYQRFRYFKNKSIASIDYSKAFDGLQPNILSSEMQSYGINRYILYVVYDFLSWGQQCVKYSDTVSNFVDTAYICRHTAGY